MLQLHSVSKSFGAKTVLDAVSAHLSTTGVTLLSGPNGAGKTTLIRCILGLETHTGRITWDGRALKPADRRCAPVFDDTPLHPKLTGHQNLVVLGSGDLLETLMGADLVDEWVLPIHPVVLGTGRRLFPDGVPPATLALIGATPTTTGVIIATYETPR